MTAASGLDHQGWGQGVCAGDYDNDGRVDLFVTYYGRSVLYRNQGGGVFTDATRPAGLAAPERYSTGCAFLDYDRDGRLDLFVSAYLAHEDARRYPPGTAGQNCSWKGLAVMCAHHGQALPRAVLPSRRRVPSRVLVGQVRGHEQVDVVEERAARAVALARPAGRVASVNTPPP